MAPKMQMFKIFVNKRQLTRKMIQMNLFAKQK